MFLSTSYIAKWRNACVAGDSATMHLIGVSFPSCFLLRSDEKSFLTQAHNLHKEFLHLN